MMISWSDGGTSFCIKNPCEFATSVLPYYYKHSNMASFIRQLNMYGFHKVIRVETGALKEDKDETEFSHFLFNQSQEHLLVQIKSKLATTTLRSSLGFKQEFLPH